MVRGIRLPSRYGKKAAFLPEQQAIAEFVTGCWMLSLSRKMNSDLTPEYSFVFSRAYRRTPPAGIPLQPTGSSSQILI